MKKKLNINEFAKTVHALAKDKGFHPGDRTEDAFVEAACNNLHDEVSELHEAWRNNHLHKLCDKSLAMQKLDLPMLTCAEEELADIVIRGLDAMIRLGINPERALMTKHLYNSTRGHRHGNKRS